MRAHRILTTVLLAGAALFGSAAGALADSPSPSAVEKGDGPTEAGTTFRTATPIKQDQHASASASTGDYLYWTFPADVGQRATVTARVALPEAATRHGAATWQIDVYDGLRRRQPCTHGRQTTVASAQAASVELSCTLRGVRGWAEPWSNDPLPGSYYLRLTVLGLPDQDLGLPFQTEVKATMADTGGAHAVDGALSTPLVPGTSTRKLPAAEPEDGWSSGWWSDRWVWTVIGGILGALAGIGGYSLTRARPSRTI